MPSMLSKSVVSVQVKVQTEHPKPSYQPFMGLKTNVTWNDLFIVLCVGLEETLSLREVACKTVEIIIRLILIWK